MLNIFRVANGPRYVYGVDAQNGDFFSYKIDPHVLFTFYAFEIRPGVRQVFVDDRCRDVYRVWIQNRSADQREVFTTNKQHLLQLDPVAHVRWPVTVDDHQIVVSNFELLAAHMYDSEQPIVFGDGVVNGLDDTVGERFKRDGVVDDVFLADWSRERAYGVCVRCDYSGRRVRSPHRSGRRFQHLVAQHVRGLSNVRKCVLIYEHERI